MTETEPADVSPPETLGRSRAPRVLFVSDDQSGATLAKQFEDRIPTAKVVTSTEFSDVWQAGYNLVVLCGVEVASRVQLPLHILQFGGVDCGCVITPQMKIEVRRDQTSPAQEWVVPKFGEVFHDQVRQDLLRLVPMANRSGSTGEPTSTPVLSWIWDAGAAKFPNYPSDQAVSLLEDVHGAIYAAFVFREPKGSIHFILPDGASKQSWLSFALRILSAISPEAFPLRSGWAEIEAFQTSGERAARAALADIAARRATIIGELDAEEERQSKELEEASTRASALERRLISDQGRELVAIVKTCLEALGFEVTDSDDGADPSALLEDLQFTAPELADSVGLIEVRGYKGGAAVSDLQRIARFAINFTEQNGKRPGRLWYIVNQFIGRTPGDRPRPLTSHAADVEQFAESSGLAVDTADLLKLWIRVECGEVSQHEARRLLLDASGVFALPD